MNAQVRLIEFKPSVRQEKLRRVVRGFAGWLDDHWAAPTIIMSIVAFFYGAALMVEHFSSDAIANHSLLNFTPQLTIGLTLFVGGTIALVASIGRATRDT